MFAEPPDRWYDERKTRPSLFVEVAPEPYLKHNKDYSGSSGPAGRPDYDHHPTFESTATHKRIACAMEDERYEGYATEEMRAMCIAQSLPLKRLRLMRNTPEFATFTMPADTTTRWQSWITQSPMATYFVQLMLHMMSTRKGPQGIVEEWYAADLAACDEPLWRNPDLTINPGYGKESGISGFAYDENTEGKRFFMLSLYPI